MRYNPATGQHEPAGDPQHKTVVPCLINFISKERQFRDYGDKINKMAIVRFSQKIEPFTRAIIKDEIYRPYDEIDAPIKGAVRLVKVVE